jgi:carbon monoxide dehydrogenase subunit G
MLIQRSVTTAASPATVFAYLADFTTTNEWDPATVTTTRTEGDGGIGTVYDNTSKFLGRETKLEYVVTEYVEGKRITLRGENKSVVAHDTITVSEDSPGTTRVDYRAEFNLKGLSKLAAPLLAPAFHKLGNDSEQGLSQALNQLSA